MAFSKLLTFSLAVVLISIILPRILLKDKEITYDDIQHKEFTPNMLQINSPPETMVQIKNGNENPQYNFGRYFNPILKPTLHELNLLQTIFQKKEWHFVAVSDGSLLIGMAVANLGYIETSFIYFYDTKNNIHDKISFVLPGGANAAIVAPSSVGPETCSRFASSLTDFKVEICFLASSNSWKLKGVGKLEKKSTISFEITLERSDLGEFSLVYPLGPSRAAYTHKTSALSAEGFLSLSAYGSSKFVFQSFSGTGLTDYSRTLARTFTEWFWIAFSLQQPSEYGNGLHGVQLSQGVYRFPTHSPKQSTTSSNDENEREHEHGDLENIIWIHQIPFYLDSMLRFTIFDSVKQETVSISPGQGQVQLNHTVTIKSDDKRISLTYQPLAQLPTELTTPIFSGRLFHTYGVYSGYIIGNDDEIIEFNNIPGVFEDHYANW